MELLPSWPDDPDGDVFRALDADGFDFSAEHVIDFNVDFDHWPPQEAALRWLASRFVDIEVHAPQDEFRGYVGLQINARLNYELVTRLQAEITEGLKPFGGRCESWGVMQPDD